MADLAQLHSALIKADAAGDADGAKMLADEIRSMQTPAKAEPPSYTAVVGNALNKGLAALPDTVLNAPTNLWNLGKAAVGAGAYALGKKDFGDSIEMTPPPDLARKGMEKLNLIRQEAEPQTTGQRIVDSAVQGAAGMALAPGAGLAGAARNAAMGAVSGADAGLVRETTGNEALATASSMLTPTSARAIGRTGREKVAAAMDRKAQNAVRDQTLAEGQAEGYVVPPSSVRPSAVNNVLESIAGKAAIKQEASIRNQSITNQLANKAIGLPEETALTEARLAAVRDQAAQPYRDIADLSRRPSPTPAAPVAQPMPGQMPSIQDLARQSQGEQLAAAVMARKKSSNAALPQEPGVQLNPPGSVVRPVMPERFPVKEPEVAVNPTGSVVQRQNPADQPTSAPKREINPLLPALKQPPQEAALGALESAVDRARRLYPEKANLPTAEELLAKRFAERTPTPEPVAPAPPEPAPIPPTGAMLHELKEARYQANLHYRHFDKTGDPAARTKAMEYQGQADRLESQLEDAAMQAGRPELVEQLREARTKIAKTFDVERNLNIGDANVSAPGLGRALDKGKPLTGELNTIARMAEAFPQVTREAAKVPSAGVSATNAITSTLFGAGGAAAFGPFGAAAAALPFARGPVRSAMLSPYYQRHFATPNYGQGKYMSQIPDATNPEVALQAALIGAIQARKQGKE